MTRVAQATPPKPPTLPAALVNVHRHNNRTTAANWERYRAHRERVTELVLSRGEAAAEGRAAVGRRGGTLALLGAGNCNDVDLARLTQRYREVHLVDVDRDAVHGAVARQSREVASALVPHAPLDLSGFLDRLPELRSRRATPGELGALPESGATQVLTSLPFRFDTVASTCLLSQLMHGCFSGLGPAHPQLHMLGSAAAVVHVRSLLRLLKPGGTAILVSDLCSSETYPLDEESTAQDGLVLLEYLDETGNVFSGTSISMIRNILAEDPYVAPLVESSRLVRPWLWPVSEKLTLLVYGLVITRR
jgi:hypothetical protein